MTAASQFERRAMNLGAVVGLVFACARASWRSQRHDPFLPLNFVVFAVLCIVCCSVVAGWVAPRVRGRAS